MKYTIAFLLIFSHCCTSLSQVTSLSDEFESPCALYDWTDVSDHEGWDASHLEVKNTDISNTGQLTMMPYTTGWYQNYRSTLLFKEVSGDFTFTTYVSASNRAEDDMPGSLYSLAGIMIRTPRPEDAAINNWQTGMANYVFMALGFAATNHPTCQGCQGPHFEVKSTTNSNSNLRVESIGSLEAEIRMVRVNDAVLVLYKTPGDDYIVHQRYYRPDMPDTVQIGFVTYTDWANVSGMQPYFHNSNDHTSASFQPDLIAKFDYGRLRDIDLPMNLENANFHQPSSVSDATILTEFGYDSEYTGRSGWKIWKGTVDGDWSDASNWSDGSLPTVSDSILIPNCTCPEVTFPIITSGSYSYPSLVLKSGASLSIGGSASLVIDLTAQSSTMNNEGTITNDGTLTIANLDSKEVVNAGDIICSTGSICDF